MDGSLSAQQHGRKIVTEMQIQFTSEERKFLCDLLQNMLKNTQVEEHRTRTPSYRKHIVHEEELIRAVLDKLQEPR